MTLSPNTQAILLLTAPLIHGRAPASQDLLSPGDYRRLALRLRELGRQPADLIAPDAAAILQDCAPIIEKSRLQRLLGRGLALSQAVEQWQSRAIWVVSRADPEYPGRFKARLRENAPAVLYGCGDIGLLGTGGLAVVGSRHVSEDLLDYTKGVGLLAACAGRTLVSGGAKGVDLAAMNGALEGGGTACGVVAAALARMVTQREHRDLLLEGRLALVSPYDPGAGFNVGHAMQRNKLIYALADAALVVSSDEGKGGTWTGAIEQLDKLRFAPLYVRSTGKSTAGLQALATRGAYPWPDPDDVDSLDMVFEAEPQSSDNSGQFDLMLAEPGTARSGDSVSDRSGPHEAAPIPLTADETRNPPPATEPPTGVSVAEHSFRTESESKANQCTSESDDTTPADRLFSTVRLVVPTLLQTPKGEAEVGAALGVSSVQARAWLRRLHDEGVLERMEKPVLYRLKRT